MPVIVLVDQQGIVTDALAVDAPIPEHLLHWIVAPDNAGFRWRLVNDEWLPPEPEPMPIPESVSRFQARAALYRMGYLEAAEALTQAAGGEILLAWQDAGEFRRDSAAINGLSFHLGLSDDDLDSLFLLAATITA